jgi:3'-phosphoadenosine 5'-phosphosulfate sulfotransferase (PAPS reductase)/FAD synthetase
VNPYRIEGPAVIAFSGGRTSGYMLKQIIDAHGGTLPDDVVPVFCNTGKEHDATLDFVRDCAERWNVRIRWVEYRAAPVPADRWVEVDHATASRDGRPFADLIGIKSYLPNPVTRFCTSELKIKASMRFVAATLTFDEMHSRAVGLRADEPRRVAGLRARYETGKDGKDGKDGWPCFPLYEAGATKGDVAAFWRAQPFDLGLPMAADGTTPMGNCDLCFLKAFGKISSIIAREPQRAVWWAAQEQRVGNGIGAFRATFTKNRPSYTQMLAQGTMFAGDDEDALDCACTD